MPGRGPSRHRLRCSERTQEARSHCIVRNNVAVGAQRESRRSLCDAELADRTGFSSPAQALHSTDVVAIGIRFTGASLNFASPDEARRVRHSGERLLARRRCVRNPENPRPGLPGVARARDRMRFTSLSEVHWQGPDRQTCRVFRCRRCEGLRPRANSTTRVATEAHAWGRQVQAPGGSRVPSPSGRHRREPSAAASGRATA